LTADGLLFVAFMNVSRLSADLSGTHGEDAVMSALDQIANISTGMRDIKYKYNFK
jgi:hypothetical protein